MAKAVDATASVPKTASATRFVSRCSPSLSDDRGDPISARFRTEYKLDLPTILDPARWRFAHSPSTVVAPVGTTSDPAEPR